MEAIEFKKITKIAIGKEGGVPAEELRIEEYDTFHQIYCLQCNKVIDEKEMP